ncbi:hypothetical protein CsatB_003798 [Cannabis sativa]
MVDVTSGFRLLSFMDAYSGYNQIKMHIADQECSSFTTDKGVYCYLVMPFGLKNADATYQRMVNRMFKGLLGRNIEVYVDDMLVKSKACVSHADDLAECFEVVRRQRGIEANPKKIQALLNMPSPKKHKDVQSLTRKVPALSRFISRSTNKCILFFNILKKCQKFEWTEECEKALRKLKEHTAKSLILSKPVHGEDLLLYLAISENGVTAALVREEDKVQHPVYYVSKRVIGAEIRYPLIEKLVFCLLMASKKLRPYFQAHPIKVLTNHPLRQVLQKPKASRRLLKWAMELSQFDIHYVPCISIKGMALADFITECNEAKATSSVPLPRTAAWKVFVDGASNENGFGAGIAMISPDGLRLQYKVERILRDKNTHADCLAKLASGSEIGRLGVVPVEHLAELSIRIKDTGAAIEQESCCMDPIIRYITKGELPQERALSRRLKYQEHRYVMMDSILYRRGLSMPYLSLPHKIVSGNGKQFECEEFTNFYNQHRVIKSFSAVARPQTNGQAEVVNKILKVTLKKKMLACKNNSPEELPKVLWAYRTTPRTTTGHSAFSMAYHCEAMVPVESLFPSHRRMTYDRVTNKTLLQEALDQIDKLRDES